MSTDRLLWFFYRLFRHSKTPRDAYRQARKESRKPLPL